MSATLASYPSRSRLSGVRAFTLVEISVVVLIIGLVASIAVPQIKKSVITARSETVINDMRVFSQAFEHYLQEKGDWPPATSSPGEYPSGMEGYLSQSNWSRRTPIGGLYNWQNQVRHSGLKITAAIAISSAEGNEVSSDQLQLEDIDRRIDDGDLSTGSFRLGFGNEPIYIIEL
ncbi:MAG: type II secretion system protein [Opitutaceae bacterium]|jgi:prepilin-type N-terminal cleavage/methylation domain-containing protein